MAGDTIVPTKNYTQL